MESSSDAMLPYTVTLKMDSTMLHCIFYAEPLSTPVLKCKGGNLACLHCDSEPPRSVCHLCQEPSGGFKHDLVMDAIVSAATVECSHSSCRSLVVYHKAHDHEIAWLHTPCACLETGCNFAASPAELAVHLAEVHSIKVHKLPPYDTTKVFNDGPVPVQGRTCRRLIAQGEDGAVFVLTICAQGLTIIVSIVCVRAKASVWPLYMVSMWADRPSTSSADRTSRMETVTVKLEASSSDVPGDVVLDDLSSYLSVPPGYLSGETFKTPHFSIRIHKENDSYKDQDALRRGAYDLMAIAKDARDN